MNSLPLYLLVAGLLCLTAFCHFIIYPVFLSPLAKIPTAHWSSSFSTAWIQYWRIKHINTFKVHEAHQKYGPVVRTGPNELSLNCIEGGLRTIYAGGYEKGDWYSNVFNNYNIKPMFSMEDRGSHSKRKRMISNVYAKSTLQNSQSLTDLVRIVAYERLLPQLQAFEADKQVFDIYDVFVASMMDIVTGYVMGSKNGSDFVRDLPRAAAFGRQFKAKQQYTVWAQDLPKFTAFMTKLGLRSILVAPESDRVNPNPDIEDWILAMCEGAEATIKSIEAGSVNRPADYPTVYSQLRTSMLKEVTKQQADEKAAPFESIRFEIASELVDHLMAGYDTSSITMTWLAWELSLPANSTWQTKLQQELCGIGDHPDAKTIDSLPILEAILMESLRLHAAIPGNQPRVTPPNATLGPPGQMYSQLPANVRVQSQAWSLHRNPEVFPDPDSWQPARWLDATEEQYKEMLRWFWAFGSGGRMCVGSNLAIYQMKAIIALIWSHFSTSIVFDEGMIPNGGYQAEPLGVNERILEVRLRKIK